MAIKAFRTHTPKATLTASFDTAFHTTIPAIYHTYAIPYEISNQYHIKRYGFHGLSHSYITDYLANYLDQPQVTFVNLHLGNGASICAIKDSQSLDTTMGFTPLEGLMMGTRAGDIDPALYSYLARVKGWDINRIETMLNRESGLLGISGHSSDIRDLEACAATGNNRCILALEMFAQRAADYVAEYANKLGGRLDAIVFTAGIGENAARVRADIISRLHYTNITLDPLRNLNPFPAGGDIALISTPESSVAVYVIRTNEELVIARESIGLK